MSDALSHSLPVLTIFDIYPYTKDGKEQEIEIAEGVFTTVTPMYKNCFLHDTGYMCPYCRDTTERVVTYGNKFTVCHKCRQSMIERFKENYPDDYKKVKNPYVW